MVLGLLQVLSNPASAPDGWRPWPFWAALSPAGFQRAVQVFEFCWMNRSLSDSSFIRMVVSRVRGCLIFRSAAACRFVSAGRLSSRLIKGSGAALTSSGTPAQKHKGAFGQGQLAARCIFRRGVHKARLIHSVDHHRYAPPCLAARIQPAHGRRSAASGRFRLSCSAHASCAHRALHRRAEHRWF